MKQRTIFIYCMTLLMLVGLISCEGGKAEKNLLIDLPQLTEEISGKTLSEIDAILEKKGYIKFYDEVEEGEYVEASYINGIANDTTISLEDMLAKLQQVTEDATILSFYGPINKDQVLIEEIVAGYIAIKDLEKSYKKVSNNLYSYVTTNYPFVLSTESDGELKQMNQWVGVINADTDEMVYSNQDQLLSFILNNGLISEEDYAELKEELAAKQAGDRDAFLDMFSQATGNVQEQFVGVTEGQLAMGMIFMMEENNFRLEAIPMFEVAWVPSNGVEWNAPQRVKKIPIYNPLK
jgi:hypothetical protein